MAKTVPKKHRCIDCSKEQYTNKHCYGCGGESFERIPQERRMFYSVVCSRCGKGIGRTDEVPSVAVCLDCYYQKD